MRIKTRRGCAAQQHRAPYRAPALARALRSYAHIGLRSKIVRGMRVRGVGTGAS